MNIIKQTLRGSRILSVLLLAFVLLMAYVYFMYWSLTNHPIITLTVGFLITSYEMGDYGVSRL